MAIKELALIKEARNRKKKKETTPAIIKPIKEVVKNKKGITKINRAKVSEKPNAQNTTQNRILTNKERLTSKPTTGNINRDIRSVKTNKNTNKDIRTVKTNNKRYSTKIVDIYERDGQYYYKDGKKEKTIDTNFVKNAIKSNRNGVIGAYDSKGKLRETDERGNIKTAKGIRKEKVQNLKNQLNTWGDNIKSGNISVSQAITDAANTFDAATDFGPGKFYKNAAKNRINALDRLWTGSTRALEGVMDTANDLTSAITQRQNYAINRLRGMSEKDAKKEMEEEQKANADWVKRDLVNEFKDKTGYNKIQPSLEEGSIVKKDNRIGKTLEGVGGMLPSLAFGQKFNLGLATKSTEGLPWLQKAGTIIGNTGRRFVNQAGANTVLAGQSYGSGIEEAYANGATGKQARMFGLLNTVTELGTEWLSSGIPGTKSEGVLDDIVESLIDRKTAKISNKYVSNVINSIVKSQAKGIGEGIEEALAEIINPYIKNLTYSDGEKVDWKDVKDSALTGYFVGMFLNSPETIQEVKQGINDAKIETARKEQLLNEIDQMVEEAKVYTPEQREQANEIAERVASGQIKENEGLALIEQIKDGTYQQNRNLEQIATQERQNLIQAAQQGQITPQQYTQGLQTLANTVNQTREEINTPQQEPYEEMRNELRQENEGTQQNETANNQQESTQESTFNNEQKQKQFDIIQNNNPMENDINTGIRNVEDIKTLDETLKDSDWAEYDEFNPDLTKQDIQNAIEKGTITVYSSYPIEQGVFVSPSKMEAESYSGDGKIYSQEVPIQDVAWIDPTQGQYAKVDNNVETNQNENIPATKSENVISEEVKPQTQETTNENVNQNTETQPESKGPEILDKMPTEKKSIFNKLKEKYNAFRHHFTDHREAWYDLSRETRNPDINSRADAIDLANGKAQVDIGRAQIDYNGKRYKNFTDENGNKVSMSFEGAYDLYNKIPVKAKNEFLVHNLNIDRLNQGVDQFKIPIQESQAKLAELRQTYPDIDKWAENIYQYYRNLAQKLVDGGRLPQSKVNEWQTTTPHYVHIQRDMGQKGNSGVDTKNGRVDSDRLIQKVKGGNYPILPIKQTTADFTRNSIEALQINNLGKEYLKTVGVGSKVDGIQEINDIDDIFGINQDLIKDDGKGNYTFVVYDKGIPVEVPISKDMYEGLKPRDIRKAAVTSDIVKFQREIITNKNPIFGLFRNPAKDVQAMALYSKHGAAKTGSTYAKLFTGRIAGKMFQKNNPNKVSTQDIVDLFYDVGNQANSYYNNGEFESEKRQPRTKAGKALRKISSALEKANNFMESMPRITEFWNTIQSEGYTINKSGDGPVLVPMEGKNPTKSVEQVLMEASHDAAEITVNFKRGGTWGKNLDKNFAVYSSPAIQGAAKFGRTVTEAVGDAKAGDYKALTRLVSRAAALGIAPALLSEAMYGDDDDYKDIQEYQKDQYYLIKRPDGKWIRIPKGREISTIQSLTRRGMNKASGEKDAFKGYGSFAINQVGPTNPLESNFASPLISAFLTNRSWSGNPIVSKYMEDNLATEDQFNEKTDEFSKWLGKQTGISPMKINYILDQYSGGLGDVALPYITPKANNNTNNPVSSILKNEFSFDQANSSKSVSKFYDAKNEINKAFKKRNASDEDKVKKVYMGTISQSLFDLSTKKREIQMDKNLSKKEKYEQALDVQKKMNKLTSDAVKNLDKVEVGENTATIGGILLYKNKNSKNGWSQESEKTTKNREKLGLSPEKYYYYKNEESYTPPGKEYSQSITSGKNAKYNIAIVDAFNFDPSDYLEYKYKLSKIRGNKDSRGRTIRYSARNKKIKYLNTLPISAVEKAYLMKQNDKYYKGSDYNLKKAISNSSLSNKEKKELYSYLKLGR